MKKSFKLFYDSLDVLDDLTDEQAGQLFKAIREYEINEVESLSGLMKAIFVPFKNNSDNCKKHSRLGEYHWNWKGGITNENHAIRNSTEYNLWRLLVFERDNYSCQWCLSVGGELEAHHVRKFSDFPELRLVVENGLTLCKKCHKKVHHD